MTLESIRTTASDERATTIATLTLAFSSDPTMRWIYPDPDAYLENMPHFTEALGGASFAHGSAYVTEPIRGAALWFPPGTGSDGPAMERLFMGTTSEAVRGDLPDFLGQMEKFHPHESHWYLSIIGVEPLHHGQGLGAALMTHALSVCDRDGLPAYLESTNPRNISLYLRHGFEVVGEIQSGSSPIMTPMLRPARRG